MKEYIPSKFKGLVNPYIELGVGKIEWTYPSGQMWLNMSNKEKQELANLMTQVGESLSVYIDELRKVSPGAQPYP